MLASLTLSALVIAISLPGLGSLPKLRSRHVVPTAADSLPPAWKPASRLAMENQFVFGTLPVLAGSSFLRLNGDPRRLRVSLDPDSGAITLAPEFGEVTVGSASRRSLAEYTRESSRLAFKRQWADRSRASINTLTGVTSTSAQTPGLSFKLPDVLPKRVQGILGPGGPALNISGSEIISLSGQSNWTNQQTGILGQRKSLFPSLDMQQNLDIRLEGQLSDRVRVNLLQNSGFQLPLANRIAINYKGDEDDLVQALDLGNTNLSLPGTQYVSYSGKNEGLFGVKLASRLGPFDFTVLTSKQEGRSERANYAGGASQQAQQIRDLDYLKGFYFLLYDPNGPAFDIPDSSIRVYLDENSYTTDINTKRGRAMVFPESLAVADTTTLGAGPVSARGTFKRLFPGADQDFEILSNLYGPNYKVIRLKRPIDTQRFQVLAVSYLARHRDANGNLVERRIGGETVLDSDGSETLILKLLWVHASLLKASDDRFDPNLALYPVRDLELRSFYQLPGQRIDPASLRLAIRRGTDQPFVTKLVLPDNTSVPYIEALGLDNYDETTGTPVRAHDGKVDQTTLTANTRAFVDFESGILFFPEPRPFAPRLGPQGKPFDIARAAELNRRASLADFTDGPNATIYDKYLPRSDEARYWIDVEFTAARAAGEIVLGRSNLVDGSEVVTINGTPLVRERDYTIDYDLGRIVMKKQLGAADQLNIDYSYAPLFQQAGKTLLGSAFRYEGRDKSFGGAFMYESKGAQDLRPRLGEEPARSLIGDLNSDFALRPIWLTRAVDRLPGVRTTEPSEFRVQAEVGASFPNPNTRNEVYIDDMEGVRDAVTLSMTAERWLPSSVPSRLVANLPTSLVQLRLEGDPIANAELRWYSPYAVVKEKDLKPTLTDAQGAQNTRQVLALSLPRRPTTASPSESLWVGLTYPLDQSGLDLSKSQFIELWVNDFNDRDRIRDRRVRLHVDLGSVSEDQMRSPEAPPNGLLDSEDADKDRQLVVAEDTGVDGIANAIERDSLPVNRDLDTANDLDPQGDNFKEPDDTYKELDPRRYRYTNGTENNRLLIPVAETEDLNLNNNLDTNERYYEYTIDLGDPRHPYLGTDIQRDFPGVSTDNGWRRYRIPIGDEARSQFGVPALDQTRHVRVWLEGLYDPNPAPDANNRQRPLLMLGGLEIVGSRWRVNEVSAGRPRGATSVTLNSVNSIDNADEYEPPFDPGESRTGNQGFTRREQSFRLEFEELRPDSAIEAYRTFSLDEDYSRYGRLNWYATGFKVFDQLGRYQADSLRYYVRFSSDEAGSNYYEYRAPLSLAPDTGLVRRGDWQQVLLDLTELSGLKLNSDFPRRDTIYTRPRGMDSTVTLIVKGRPSFTRLRRVSFGLVNVSHEVTYRDGQLWFNELRATEVAKDRGQAQRVLVTGRAANLLSYSLTWEGRSADFLTVGQTRGSGNGTRSINFNSNVDLHRFFEGTGILLPVTFGFAQNRSQPRFNVGDDVVRTGSQSSANETFGGSRNVGASYSRTWNERSNPLLRYTLGGITASANHSSQNEHNPTLVGTGNRLDAAVRYQVAPRKLLSLDLPWTKAKLFPLPERFFWNYDMSRQRRQDSDRLLDSGNLVRRAAINGRSARITFGANSRPVELIQHEFDGVRNLMLGGSPQHLGFIYLGKMVNWRQSFRSRYALNKGPWFQPSASWSSGYTQDNGPELSRDLSIRSVTNRQELTTTYSLPFDQLVRRVAVRDTSRNSTRAPAWRGILGRLGSIQTDFSARWNSSDSRLLGTPSLLYLVGLSSSPGPQGLNGPVRETFGNVSMRGFNWNSGARTRLDVGRGASLQTSFNYTDNKSNSNSIETRTQVTRFPEFTIDYGQLASVIKLNRFIQNPRLNTSFNRSITADESGGIETQNAKIKQWSPLIGVAGDLRNGARMDLKVERRETERVLNQLGTSKQVENQTAIDCKVNRSYNRGQKVSFLGKEKTVNSSINLGLSARYDKKTGETTQPGRLQSKLRVDNDRLSVNGSGSYQFSNSVQGNLELGFAQDRDKVLETVRRNVRVELRTQFTF